MPRYLGAAKDIVEDEYLTVAGSILAVEARHTSYIRASLGQSPFPNPFDTPLGYVSQIHLQPKERWLTVDH